MVELAMGWIMVGIGLCVLALGVMVVIVAARFVWRAWREPGA